MQDLPPLIEPLATALADAIVAAVADEAALEPFFVDVQASVPLLPPRVRIAGRAFRDALREASGRDHRAILELDLGAAEGLVVTRSLAGRLDADALDACRALSERPAEDGPHMELISAFAGRLARHLCPRAIPGTVDPFLVSVGVRYLGWDSGWMGVSRARDALGDAAVDRFLQSTRARAVRPPVEQILAAAHAAETDRAAFARLLSLHGLDPALADRAALQFELRPTDRADARSRLVVRAARTGTVPVRAALLAAIDLSELRTAGGDERLPATGWLSCYDDGRVTFADDEPDAGDGVRIEFAARFEPPNPEHVGDLPAAARWAYDDVLEVFPIEYERSMTNWFGGHAPAGQIALLRLEDGPAFIVPVDGLPG